MTEKSDKTIIVVDNNPANLEIWADILSKEEYKVIKAHDGRDGLLAAQQYQPDLMIIDKELPVMSSDDLARQLKADKRLKKIPLLSVMDSAYKSCDLDIYEDCVTKPLSLRHLLEIVENVIQENSIRFDSEAQDVQQVC